MNITAGATIQYRKVGKAILVAPEISNVPLEADGTGWWTIQFITGPKQYRQELRRAWVTPDKVIAAAPMAPISHFGYSLDEDGTMRRHAMDANGRILWTSKVLPRAMDYAKAVMLLK